MLGASRWPRASTSFFLSPTHSLPNPANSTEFWPRIAREASDPLGCALFAAAPANAAFPGANGELAYVGFANYGGTPTQPAGIQAIKPDGSNNHQLLNPSPIAIGPNWSPDGRLITYYRLHNGGTWIANADGSDPRQILAGPTHASSFSPSGKRLLFMGGGRQIESARLDGTDERLIYKPRTSHYVRVSYPAYSPDGSQIAYVRNTPRPRICVVHRNGSDNHCITGTLGPSSGFSVDLDWSPDGKRLVFNSGDPRKIETMRADGSDRKVVVPETFGYPVYSPDGRWIAWPSYDFATRPDCICVDVARTNGSHRRTVIPLPAGGPWISWQPLPVATGGAILHFRRPRQG